MPPAGKPVGREKIKDYFKFLCPEQESNLHALKQAPAPQAGVSTNSTIWAGSNKSSF